MPWSPVTDCGGRARQAAEKRPERARFMRVGRLAAVAAGVSGLIAVNAATGLAPAIPKPAPSPGQSAGVVVRPGVIRMTQGAQAAPLTTADCEKDFNIACYGPAQVRRAYGLPALYAKGVTGRGATIVIVDSYGSPTIRNDLTVFDRAYRLPAPRSSRSSPPRARFPLTTRPPRTCPTAPP